MRTMVLAFVCFTFISCSKFDAKITMKEKDCRPSFKSELIDCYYIVNTSTSKKLKFTVKESITENGSKSEEFDTYSLEPGEMKRLGPKEYDNSFGVHTVVDWEVTGQQELPVSEN